MNNSNEYCFYRDEWLLHGSWSLHDACYLVFGVNPKLVRPEDQLYEEHEEFYKLAYSDLKVGLKTHENASYYEPATVKPEVFVKWADKRGYTIPEGLKHLLNLKTNKPLSTPPSTKQIHTYLGIIYVLAKQCGLEIETSLEDAEDDKKPPKELLDILSCHMNNLENDSTQAKLNIIFFTNKEDFYNVIYTLLKRNEYDLVKHYSDAEKLIRYASLNKMVPFPRKNTIGGIFKEIKDLFQ